jgi:ribosomal protein S18 acetylase RimI-like enzyme
MNFNDALTTIYYENPCQVLPTALWKILARTEDLQTYVGVVEEDIIQIKAWNENSLMVYWTRNRQDFPDFGKQSGDLQLALIHQDYLSTFSSTGFAIQKPYFRLLHKPSEVDDKVVLCNGFSFEGVKVEQDAGKVSQLIGQCYSDMDVTTETVLEWTKHPTYDPSLWVWVMDDKREIPVGLGIAEFDGKILEGSLEWIQVLSEYRGMKIGKSIVQELLSRLKGRVKFTTVSGEVDNVTKPEALYRSCGFTGSDIWWMFGN